jgi:hypothetical protein
MNKTNQFVWDKSAVDIWSAAMLLLKLEGDRLIAWKEQAWQHE